MAQTARISRDDIEAKFKELKEDVEDTTDEAKNYALTIGAAGVVALVLVVFIAGRRRGRRSRAIVEIRRI